LVSSQCRGDLAVAVLLQGGSLEPIETYGHFTLGSVGILSRKISLRPVFGEINGKALTITDKTNSAGVLVGYARVSTRSQDTTLQLDALKAAGCGKIFVEKASGAQRDRPELLAALDYMRPGDTLHAARRYACDLEA
jgi:hypothetical protein